MRTHLESHAEAQRTQRRTLRSEAVKLGAAICASKKLSYLYAQQSGRDVAEGSFLLALTVERKAGR